MFYQFSCYKFYNLIDLLKTYPLLLITLFQMVSWSWKIETVRNVILGLKEMIVFIFTKRAETLNFVKVASSRVDSLKATLY